MCILSSIRYVHRFSNRIRIPSNCVEFIFGMVHLLTFECLEMQFGLVSQSQRYISFLFIIFIYLMYTVSVVIKYIYVYICRSLRYNNPHFETLVNAGICLMVTMCLYDLIKNSYEKGRFVSEQ